MNKVEHDVYIECLIKNIISTEVKHLVDNQEPYQNWHDTYVELKEEVEETIEEMHMMTKYLADYWQLCITGAPREAFKERLELLEHVSENIIHKAKQVAAMSQKALNQLS